MTGKSPGALRAELERRFRTTVSEVPLAGRTLRILHPANADELISEEDFVRDERLPYWADIWPSSLALADRVLQEAGAGRRLLELGCGAGLVASAAALAGFDVTATDYYHDAVRFARVNAWENARTGIHARHADWRDWPAGLRGFDVVIASDVLYEKNYAMLVADVFALALRPDGLGIITDPGRYAVPTFLEHGKRIGLDVRRTAQVPFESGDIRQTIDIYEVRRPATTSAMS